MKKESFMQIVRGKAKQTLTQEEEAMFGTIGEAVEKAFEADSIERKKQIDEITSKLGTLDGDDSIAGVVRALAQRVDEAEAKNRTTLNASEKYLLRKALETKKDEIQKIMRKETQNSWSLEFKTKRAAAMHTTANVITGATAFNTENIFDSVDIAVLRYPANFILDNIGSRQVARVPEVWRWKEEVAGDGTVATVAEGAEKTLQQFKYIWNYSSRKKYAGRIELTEEAELDFDQLYLDIVNMFELKVLRAYNDGVLADILAWTPTYAGTYFEDLIVKPTIMNVVNVMKLSIQAANYSPDILVINPVDYSETQNMQDTLGNPIFVPDTALFPGFSKVIVTNKITAGTVLMGEAALVQEQHGAFILRQGVYGTQFIENEKTIVGEVFSALKLATEYKKGWVKASVATVKAALLKP